MGKFLLYPIAAYLYWILRERRLYIGTRIVEIPWVIHWLRNHTYGHERILQVGDVLLKKALNKFEVELVDLGAEENSKPGLRVYKDDIRNVSLKKCYFDIAISISTLEHIGIQGPRFPNGDKLTVEIIAKALRPGGQFLLSVPFGKPIIKNTFRVYDRARLNFLLTGEFFIKEESFFVWNKFKWQKTSSKEAERAGFLKNNPSMNLGVALVKARRK